MKTHPITLLPPAPATRRAIAAFHLRERRLRALLAGLVCAVFVVIYALLYTASPATRGRVIFYWLTQASALGFLICGGEAHHAHRALKRTEEDAR